MGILGKVCDEFEIEFGNRPVAPPHDPVGEMYGHKRDTHGSLAGTVQSRWTKQTRALGRTVNTKNQCQPVRNHP